MTGAFGRAQLAQRLRFYLANTLAGDVELLPDLFKRVLALATNSEAEPDDFLFFWRERLQNVRGFIAYIRIDNSIDRRADPAIFNEVAERRFTVAAHRCF